MAICNGGTAADPYQIYNPFTAVTTGGKVVRQAIANNNLSVVKNTITGVTGLDPVAAAYLALYPQPNQAGSATGQGNYISSTGQTADLFNNQFGRLDYNVSSRDHLFGDFRHNHLNQSKNNFFNNNSTGTLLFRENYGLTIDNVFTLNPTTIIDTRVNWTLYNEVHGTPAQQYSAATVGFPSSLGAAATESQLPCINFLGATCAANTTSIASLGDNTSSFQPTTNYQVFTDVVKVIGKHTVKVGFDGRQYRLSVRNFGNAAGTFAFATNFVTAGTSGTAQPFGGDLASFYFGLPTSGSIDNNARGGLSLVLCRHVCAGRLAADRAPDDEPGCSLRYRYALPREEQCDGQRLRSWSSETRLRRRQRRRSPLLRRPRPGTRTAMRS